MRILYISIIAFLLSAFTVQISYAQNQPVTITSAVKKSYNGSDISCASKNDAEITVTAAGGSGNYEYSKNDGASYQSSNILTGIPGNSNCLIKVRDANDKTNAMQYPLYVWIGSVNAVHINTFQRNTYYNSGNDGVSCVYNSDGAIIVLADGGSGAFQYSINNGANFQSESLFSGLSSGTYTAIAKDANGCIAYSSPSFSPVKLTPPKAIVGIVNSQTNISCPSAKGSVTVSGSGGEGNYQASIDGGRTFNYLAKGGTYTFDKLNAGDYTILIRDGNFAGTACMATPISVTIINAPFNGSITGNAVICAGSTANFVINISNSGKIFTAIYKDNSGKTYTVNNLKAGDNIITTSALSDSKIFTLVSIKNETGCSASVSGSVDVTVNARGQWLGNNSDWNNSNNWSCGAIPTSETNVIIPKTANDPVISSLTVASNNISIETGASLTVNGTLQIAGKINNKGIFDATKGTLEFNGNIAQSFSGSFFLNKSVNNLKISNTAGLSLEPVKDDTLNITGKVSFGIGKTTFNTNDNLTLKSTASATASIADITNNGLNSGNSIVGKVIVERYINIGKSPDQHGKKWLFLAFPTKGQTIKQSLMEDGNPASTGYGIQITGTAGISAGFDMASVSPSMKYYDSATGNWKGITNTSNPVYDERGYMIFVRGDRSVNGTTVKDPNPVTLRTKGTLIMGDQTMRLPANNLFATIGNPFASAIDMRKVTQSTGSDFYYIWNPALGGIYGYGAYETYLKLGDDFYSVPGFKVRNFIQSGEAFFVQTTKIVGTVTIKESAKISEGNGQISRPQGTSERAAQIRTSFYGINADGSTNLLDGTLQQFNDDYNNNIDEMDARKVFNTSEGLSIKSGGKDIIVERKRAVSKLDTVYYSLTSLKVQNYKFEFIAENLLSGGLQGFIEDAYLKTSTPLNMEGKTEVRFAVTSVAASYAANRFKIVFKQASVLPVTFTSVKAYQKNELISVEWKVENESNMQRYEIERSGDGNQFSKAASVSAINGSANSYSWLDNNPTSGYNYYRIKSVDVNGKASYTQIVKVFMGKASGEISIFPNPIVNGNVNLQLTNQPAGTYNVRLLNPLGQVMIAKQLPHAEGSSTETFKWDYNFARGVYQMEVTKPDGNVKTIKIMY